MHHYLAQCKKYRFEFLYAFLTVLLSFSPYIREDLITGSDSSFHLARIETLAQNLSYGLFSNKIHVDLCYGYGYGVGFFYPDLFLYIPALLMCIGFSLEVSFKLFAGLLLSGIFLSMFYCVYRLTKDRYAALSSSAVFLFSCQVMGSFYYTFSLGVSIALIFFPLAICGMYLFVKREETPFLLSLGFIGLLYSHMLSTFLAVIICFIILLIYARNLVRKPHRILQLFTAVLSVSAITASFWIPMLEQFSSQTFRLSEPWTWVDDNVLLLSRLFLNDGFGWTLTILVLIAGFYLICPSVSPSTSSAIDSHINIVKLVRPFYCLGFILYLLPTCGKFWEIFRSFFKFLQFPKRLLVPSSILMCFSIGLLFSFLFTKEKQKRIMSVFLLAAAFYTGINYIEGSFGSAEDFGYRVLYQEIAGIGSGEEYLPLETTRDDLTTPNIAFSDIGEQTTGVHQQGIFQFTASPDTQYYDIPLVWYKGYTACTEDGIRLEIIKNPENGHVCVQTDSLQDSAQVNVQYSGTTLMRISYAISFISLLTILIILTVKSLKHR